MSLAEKLQAMELLCRSMTTQPDKLKSPAGQGKVLSQRFAKVESGKGEFLTLAQLKKRLAKRTAREWCSFSLKPPRTLNKPGIFMTLKRPASGIGDY